MERIYMAQERENGALFLIR